MAITLHHVRSTIITYLDKHPEEKQALHPVLQLLDEEVDLTSRKEFRGHATAGAILLNGRGEVLFVHHVALGRWLLPGGHVDTEDEDLPSAALRELVEETGIRSGDVRLLHDQPVHIDVHPIPANEAKAEAAHQHIDFRFLFATTADVGMLQTEEVADAAWRAPEFIADQVLRARVRAAS